jgi:hypothetical protein
VPVCITLFIPGHPDQEIGWFELTVWVLQGMSRGLCLAEPVSLQWGGGDEWCEGYLAKLPLAE